MDFKLNKILLSINKVIKVRWRLVIAAVVIVLPLSLLLFRNNSPSVEAGWWNEMWYYRQAIPINYSGSSVLTEYQVFIDNLDTSSLITADKMQSDCDDIRFTNKNGILLDYYIVGNTCNSPDTEIWVKVNRIPPGGTTIYMYYGNPQARRYQDIRKTFTYSEEKVVGYVLNTATTAYDLISLEDGNSITHNGTTLNLDKGETSPITTSAYLPVSAKKLFNMSTENYDTIVPVGWAGTEFVYRNRSSNYATYFVMVSPWGTATVKIYINGTQCGADRTVTSSGLRVTDCGGSGYDVYRIVSDIPILVNKSSIGSDPFPLHPADKGPWYGWDSTGDNFAAGPDGANLEWIDSGMTSTSSKALSANSGDYINAGGGSYYSGDTVKVWSDDYVVAGASQADSDGGDATTYMPRYEFGTITGSPYATDYVSVLSDQPTTCTTYTASGHSIDTVTLSSANTQVYELGDTNFGIGDSNEYIGEAWYIECDKPAMFVSQYVDDEQNMWTYPMMRQFTYPTPTVGVMESEEQGPGPVAYWSFDEGYGSTAYDYSPNDNDGTINGATWKPASECKFGKCLYFDGDDDYVSVDTDNFGSTKGTVSLWVKPTNIPSHSMLFGHQNGNNRLYVGINISPALNIGIADTGVIDVNKNLVLNKWQYITFTYDSGTWIFYYNGKEISSGSYSGSINFSSNAEIGDDGGSSWTNNFPGFIDEVKIYNYARTAEQIKQDYNRGRAVMLGQSGGEYASLTDGLVGWWKMDESSYNGTADELVDSSGNERHGFASGTSLSTISTSTAKFGRASYLDGSSHYLEIPYNDFDRDDFSISFWLKTSSSSQTIFNTYSGTPRVAAYIQADGTLRFNVRGSNGSTIPNIYVYSNTVINDNIWHHVSLVRQDDFIYIYIDGDFESREAGLHNVDPGSARDSLGLGANGLYHDAYDPTYQGYIDDFRIYEKALSPEEVRHLYEWAPGPVFYMDFNENSGSSQVYDKSGNDNHGTMNGGMTEADWVSGKYGSALDFDGKTEYNYINLGTTDFGIDNKFTLSFWMKYRSSISGNYIKSIFSKSNNYGTNQGDYTIGISDNKISYRVCNGIKSLLRSSCGSYADDVGDTLEPNKWYYVTNVYDGNNFKTYVNGKLVNSTVFEGFNLGSNNYLIGTNYFNAYYWAFNGIIDDVKIYNYARTPRQILEDMNAGRKNNPIAYWSFDEGQGTTVYDRGIVKEVTGSGYDGTLTNMSTAGTSTAWTKYGKVGGALKFDGVDDYINIPDNILATSSEFSIDGWINPSGENSTESYNEQILIDLRGQYQIFLDWMETDDSNHKEALQFWIYDGLTDSVRVYSGDYTAPVNKWTHFTVTYKDNNIKLYINGELNATGTSDPPGITTSDSKIGKDYSATDRLCFKGIMDEIKIYNYALTLDEIRQNYNQGRQTVLSKSKEEVQQVTEGLVGWWKMDESSWSGNSGEVIDYSGAGNHGTAYNGANSTSTAKYGRAGEFDGGTKYVDIGDQPEYDFGNKDFTVSAWAYRNSGFGGYDTTVVGKWNTGASPGTNEWLLGHGSGSSDTYPHFVIESGNISYDVKSSETTNNNEWYYLTGVRKGDYIFIYVNGEEKARTYIGNISINNVSGRTLKIAKIDGGVYGLDGLVDDVKIYNYARSPEQIMRDYVEGPSPVGYWKFDDFSGTTAVDASGMGNDGTINGATWEVRGKKGSALSFDGSDDRVVVSNANNSILPPDNGAFTISLWFNSGEISTPSIKSIMSNETYLTSGFRFGTDNNGKLRFWSTESGGSISLISNTTIREGSWYHAVVVYTGNSAKMYINGVEDVEDTLGVVVSNTNDIHIARAIGGKQYFKGKIDEVKIYNYALTPRQVAMEYNAGAPIGYWKFDEGEGETAYDYSGNGNNGTVYIGSGGSQTSTSTAWSNGSAGKINGSLNFDGTDDYIDINHSISFPDNLTISGWFKTSASGLNQTIFFANSSSAADRIQVRIHNSNVINVLTDNSANWPSYDIMGTKIVTDGNWHHFTFVQENTQLYLYIDGELDTTEEISTNSSFISTNNKISYYISGNTQTFNGQIDEVKIWNYALTPEEVKRQYNAGFGTYFK